MAQGRIINSVAGTYTVIVGDSTFQCKPRGRFRFEGISPVTGDLVEIKIGPDSTGVIEQILPRRNILTRPTIANIDQVIVVLAPQPKPNFYLVDKVLISAEHLELNCVVVVNKTDLGDQVKDFLDYYRKTNYNLFAISVHRKEGLEELEQVCQGHISVLAGQSGVGKSSIINHFCPELNLTTQEVSPKRGFGRHTTRNVRLLQLPGGGLLADTPGFSKFDIANIDKERLAAHFPEMVEFLGQCRYTACLHKSEPDCAVIKALSNSHIHQQRYESYLAVLNDLIESEKRKYS